jgi:hypothetical protein
MSIINSTKERSKNKRASIINIEINDPSEKRRRNTIRKISEILTPQLVNKIQTTVSLSPLINRKQSNLEVENFTIIPSDEKSNNFNKKLDFYNNRLEKIFDNNFDVYNGIYTVKTAFPKVVQPKKKKINVLGAVQGKIDIDNTIGMLKKAINNDEGERIKYMTAKKFKIKRSNQDISNSRSLETKRGFFSGRNDGETSILISQQNNISISSIGGGFTNNFNTQSKFNIFSDIEKKERSISKNPSIKIKSKEENLKMEDDTHARSVKVLKLISHNETEHKKTPSKSIFFNQNLLSPKEMNITSQKRESDFNTISHTSPKGILRKISKKDEINLNTIDKFSKIFQNSTNGFSSTNNIFSVNSSPFIKSQINPFSTICNSKSDFSLKKISHNKPGRNGNDFTLTLNKAFREEEKSAIKLTSEIKHLKDKMKVSKKYNKKQFESIDDVVSQPGLIQSRNSVLFFSKSGKVHLQKVYDGKHELDNAFIRSGDRFNVDYDCEEVYKLNLQSPMEKHEMSLKQHKAKRRELREIIENSNVVKSNIVKKLAKFFH